MVDVAQSSFGAEKFLISYFEHPTPFLAAWALPSGCVRGLTSASGQRELSPSSPGAFQGSSWGSGAWTKLFLLVVKEQGFVFNKFTPQKH